MTFFAVYIDFPHQPQSITSPGFDRARTPHLDEQYLAVGVNVKKNSPHLMHRPLFPVDCLVLRARSPFMSMLIA